MVTYGQVRHLRRLISIGVQWRLQAGATSTQPPDSASGYSRMARKRIQISLPANLKNQTAPNAWQLRSSI